jgi:hypothetical protein
MEEDDMAEADERLERLREAVAGLPVPAATDDQRWRVAGTVLVAVGLAAIGAGWFGASGTRDVSDQIPYLISGGLFGLALVVLGAALLATQALRSFLRFWLLRLLS